MKPGQRHVDPVAIRDLKRSTRRTKDAGIVPDSSVRRLALGIVGRTEIARLLKVREQGLKGLGLVVYPIGPTVVSAGGPSMVGHCVQRRRARQGFPLGVVYPPVQGACLRNGD